MAIGGAVRRTALAGLAAASGGRAGDLLWGRDRLTALVYHRIGDPSAPGMEWDPAVFSATPEMFERQMRWVAANFNVVSVWDVAAHLDGGPRLPDRPLLVTFDDGYRDNHEDAFPVLRRLGLPAVVFLASGAIGTNRVMWWDELTRMVGRTGCTGADLPLVGPRSLHDGPARLSARRELAAALKAVDDDARDRTMGELRELLGVPAPVPDTPLFMDWDAVSELVAGGVDCQPHTVDHPILIRVDGDRARREIRGSAEEVARRTGRPSVAFAYPNGDWSADTMAALGEAGIRLAFTMRLGPCRAGDWTAAPLEIPRVPLDHTDSWDLFRLKASGMVSTIFGVLGRRPPMRLGTA